MLAITGDTEWAPAPIVEDWCALLDEYGVQGTLFSTHDDGADVGDHERGLHPNFYRGPDDEAFVPSQTTVLDDLAATFPDATGSRSHGLVTNTRIQTEYASRGIAYESNYLLSGQPDLEPFSLSDWVLELPIYWEDDVWLGEGASEVDVPDLLAGPGLKLFNVHPPIVFLNAPDAAYYRDRLDYTEYDVDALRAERYDGYGVRDLLRDVLAHAEATGLETRTAGEIARRHVRDHGGRGADDAEDRS